MDRVGGLLHEPVEAVLAFCWYTAERSPDNWAILVGVCGPALDVVMAAIDDDEGMVNILEWRKASRPGERHFNVVDGHALPAPATP